VKNFHGFRRAGLFPFKKKGFTCIRQGGSHKIFKNDSGTRVTVPDHAGKILHPKIVKQICKDAGINPDELG
jgi:predicted RNA binding protein YcfA (HicA-like mRNA interferase family)